jgi:RNA polymerase sigma-70 factor (ECF subfamily)
MNDADDAVQEAWIHVAGGDATGVANLEGWFTTIVARVCLDTLRYRKSRREEPADVSAAGIEEAGGVLAGPEQEVMLADSVGIALLVVLDTLAPAERVAFVLHETFGIPFAEIAAITGRSPAAARQLASRARRRIHGGTAGQRLLAIGAGAGAGGDAAASPAASPAVRARQRALAEAFLAASRGEDLDGLLAVLDPDVVLRGDSAAVPAGIPLTIRGASPVARAARSAAARSRYSGIALVNGLPGIVYAPRGQLTVVLAFAYNDERISGIDVIADPARLAALDLALGWGA